jgi:hypothetical protein
MVGPAHLGRQSALADPHPALSRRERGNMTSGNRSWRHLTITTPSDECRCPSDYLLSLAAALAMAAMRPDACGLLAVRRMRMSVGSTGFP